MKNLKNNKGFSLVELIIVVAIMAILIGILAPQYIKYVEKTRVTSDQDIIDVVRKTMETVAADPDVSLDLAKYTAEISKASGVALDSTTAGDADFKKAFEAICDNGSNRKFKSKRYATATVKVELTFDTDGQPQITVSDTTGSGSGSGSGSTP